MTEKEISILKKHPRCSRMLALLYTGGKIENEHIDVIEEALTQARQEERDRVLEEVKSKLREVGMLKDTVGGGYDIAKVDHFLNTLTKNEKHNPGRE